MSDHYIDRQAAQTRMEAAKRQFTHATEATLRGDPGAGVLVDAALIEVDEARAELHRLAEEETC